MSEHRQPNYYIDAFTPLSRENVNIRHRLERIIQGSAFTADRRSFSHRLGFTLIVVGGFATIMGLTEAQFDTGPGPLSPMLLAIGLATWYGGIAQGLIATMLGLATSYFVLDPVETLQGPDLAESVHLGALLVVAPAVALVSDGLRSSLVRTSDVAETRRMLLAAVVASEERWRHFNESVPALMSESTNAGEMTYCNARWLEYTGLTFEQIRDDPTGTAHPDDRERVDEAWRNAIATRSTLEIEWRMRRHDGAYRWHYGIAIPAEADDDDRQPMWVGVNVDIDGQRRAEAEAAFQRQMRDQSETRARLAMLAAHLESWVCEFEGDHLTVMRRELSAGRGKPSEHWSEWLARIHAQDRESVEAAVRDAIALRRELDIDFRLVERNRNTRWMHVWGRLVYGDDQQPQRLIAVQQDVTERKRAEESAREGEEHLRRLADANIIGVASGVGDVITEANDAFLSMLRYTQQDVAAHRLRWETLSPEDDDERAGDVFAELLHRGAAEPQRRDYMCRDGERRHVLVGMILLERRPFRWVTFNIDLTDQVNAEQTMHDALLAAEEANASKDEFVALVAHELRAPITTISGNAEILEKRAALIDAASRKAALADIRSESDRLRRMIQDLLVLARVERSVAFEHEPVRLERVVAEAAARHNRAFPDRAIHIVTDAALPLAMASAAYTDQVVSNLIGNAEKYSPKEQPVQVAISADDQFVRVCVRDSGAGISAEEIEQVFRPFYRSQKTAARAEGFGIGLTVCRRLVEAQGGDIWAKARPEGGTEFGFTLPVAPEIPD